MFTPLNHIPINSDGSEGTWVINKKVKRNIYIYLLRALGLPSAALNNMTKGIHLSTGALKLSTRLPNLSIRGLHVLFGVLYVSIGGPHVLPGAIKIITGVFTWELEYIICSHRLFRVLQFLCALLKPLVYVKPCLNKILSKTSKLNNTWQPQ